MSLHDFVCEMPKVELHVHLEGSIRPATLLTLAQRNRVTLPASDLESLRAFYRFTDFEHFLRVYFAIVECLQTVADFELIAYQFGADMARQNIRYAEVTFTPHISVTNSGLSFDDILAGLNAGRSRAEAEFGIEFRWILDMVRDDVDSRFRVVEWAADALDQGVVGLGLGGTEASHPHERFADAYKVAREAGLHSVTHAGENAGPESVWAAIRFLGAERIGHGVRSIEDPALVEYLKQHQIPLEVCPTSNLCLGIYASYQQHPLRQLWEQGVYVTVNSDDPPMFDTDLVSEYQILADEMGFSVGELKRLNLNALRASFLPDERKASLEEAFVADFARLRVQHLV